MGTNAGTQSQPQCPMRTRRERNELLNELQRCRHAACTVQDEQLTRIGTHTTGSRILCLLCFIISPPRAVTLSRPVSFAYRNLPRAVVTRNGH